MIAIVALLGKLEKVPFDIPEAETEIVAGAFTEYSGRLLALFRMAIDMELVVGASLLAAVFLPFGLHLSACGGFCRISREGPVRNRAYFAVQDNIRTPAYRPDDCFLLEGRRSGCLLAAYGGFNHKRSSPLMFRPGKMMSQVLRSLFKKPATSIIRS